MSSQPQLAGPPPRTQRLIRLVMAAWILIFGAVVGFLTTSGGLDAAMDDAALGVFRLVIFAVALAGLGLLLFLRNRRDRQADARQAFTYALIGWALAETVAILGAVYWLLGGGPLLYGAGVLLFGVAWMLFPIREAAPVAER